MTERISASEIIDKFRFYSYTVLKEKDTWRKVLPSVSAVFYPETRISYLMALTARFFPSSKRTHPLRHVRCSRAAMSPVFPSGTEIIRAFFYGLFKEGILC